MVVYFGMKRHKERCGSDSLLERNWSRDVVNRQSRKSGKAGNGNGKNRWKALRNLALNSKTLLNDNILR